jgi:hypothetical protein
MLTWSHLVVIERIKKDAQGVLETKSNVDLERSYGFDGTL